MAQNNLERESRIADFKKEFFENVVIQTYGNNKDLYFLTNKTGLSYAISKEELLKKSVLRAKSFCLIDTALPPMNESEYIQFIQELVKRSSVIGKR